MSLPSFDDILRQMQAMEAQAQGQPRFEPLPPNAFPAASLMAWLEAVRAAGVAHVPAQVAFQAPIDTLLRFEEGGAEVDTVLHALDQANAAVDETSMLRWDCCACVPIKAALSQGQTPDPTDRQLSIDDPRAFDLIYEFPAATIAAVRRPWVDVKTQDGYPVEFRVFVRDGEVAGVANYYLQRPLADTPALRDAAHAAVTATRAIVAHLQRTGQTPLARPSRGPDPEGIHASLDFVVTSAGQVLWLEAGPGLGFGAHPCAFMTPDGQGVGPVTGLQLGVGQAPIPAWW